jgi:hypothetical protein
MPFTPLTSPHLILALPALTRDYVAAASPASRKSIASLVVTPPDVYVVTVDQRRALDTLLKHFYKGSDGAGMRVSSDYDRLLCKSPSM